MFKTHILDKKIKQAKSGFSLPLGVTQEKTLLANGMFAYIFHHYQLGQLGRIVLVPHNGQTQFAFEIAGEPDDPMTQRRRQIFEPIARDISSKLSMIYGQNNTSFRPYTAELPKETQVVQSKIMSCNKCGSVVAMMICAPDAHTPAQLENYSRRMFLKIKETNVPSWIVGAEKDVIIDGELAGEALVLKIWPTRQVAKIIYSTKLNDIFDELMNGHC